MEDFLSILFGLAMVALPAIVKLLEKASKKKQGQGAPQSRPVASRPEPQQDAPRPRLTSTLKPSQERLVSTLSPSVRAAAPVAAASAQAVPSVRRTTASKASPPEVQKSPREKIDKRKLVIYSEIMKPKFDL